MNHEEAISSQAAAAYLLGDLSAEERDAFEEHFFDCSECGDTVRSGATMFAGGREAVENESSFRRFRSLKPALAGAAAAALVVIATYQTAVLPRVQSLATPPVMEVLRPTELMTSEMRGAEGQEMTIRFSGDDALALYPDVPPDAEPFPHYQAELRSSEGRVLSARDVPAELVRSGNSIPVLVRALPAGRYVLAIRGVRKDGNRPEVVRYNVRVVQ
jgi:hypothetical protein